MIYLLAGIVVALVLAFLFSKRSTSGDEEQTQVADDCCGAHEVCETDSLLSSSDKAEYYEDEELDAFKEKTADSYNDDEIEQFREILFTLKEREVAGWLKSLQIRQINPPEIIREEALMIVADRRGL
ncbi:phospholipase [Carboxylicivirga sp. M1479]|uniref:phospholipase n=1 Tax=Carboxylicivirga sp. M1479 TaxID=2594476 RepID=UPI00117792C0|nr:phospholipase [Carboxylicivirga sp. M1479]TRX72523.1 phospholipase [Carboxylicivirga sp. M1479]